MPTKKRVPHAFVPAPDSPTPEQMGEFYKLVKRGTVNRANFQDFLRKRETEDWFSDIVNQLSLNSINCGDEMESCLDMFIGPGRNLEFTNIYEHCRRLDVREMVAQAVPWLKVTNVKVFHLGDRSGAELEENPERLREFCPKDPSVTWYTIDESIKRMTLDDIESNERTKKDYYSTQTNRFLDWAYQAIEKEFKNTMAFYYRLITCYDASIIASSVCCALRRMMAYYISPSLGKHRFGEFLRLQSSGHPILYYKDGTAYMLSSPVPVENGD